MTSFAATYYDGKSTRQVPVTVHFDAADVLHIDGLGEPIEFALGAIRVSPRVGNTVWSITLPGGAKCETADQDAADELRRRSAQDKGSWIHEIESRWVSAIIAVVALFVVIACGMKWGIPMLARTIALALPDRVAYEVGRGTLQVLDKTMLDDSTLLPERKRELESQFGKLAANYPALPLELRFRRGIGANALALPDGTVIVTDELVGLATDDRQILAVLTHEIGHVHHRHSLRMALESSSVAVIVNAYLGDVAQVTTLSAALPAVYTQAHYSREHESEADAFAFDYLARADIPRHHFADILRALQKEHGPDADGAFGYLASHPPTSERIRRFETDQ